MLRREVQDMIDLAERLLAAGEVGVLATLFSSRGSTYRPLGSMMVAGPGSMTAGGVSGGCLEEYIARHGRLLVQESRACMLSFDADPDADDTDKPNLGCGGSIEVLVERLTAEHVKFLRDFGAAHERDAASVACCNVIIAEDGALQVERTAFSAFSGIPRGDARTLFHRAPLMTRLVILGAGDDVKPLCAIAMSLGWHVTVVDRRARRATRQRFPEVDQLIAAGWDEAIEKIAFSPRTAVVMMTHSVADDIAILPLLLEKPMAYFGALGPAHRRQWVIDGALATASLSEEFLERFKGPIGLNLGECSPAGIALAIAAEITAALNERSARPLSDLARGSSSPARITLHG
jgi:xanthine/CO dehydrogenase XdhC/CoxF family maturation factor